MKEKIKMILCLCLIIAGLPILMTLVFQGDEILLDTDSNEIQHKSSHPGEEEKMAALVSILARDISVTYEEEAIRAQAVIVRTNYEYAMSQGKAPETGLSIAEQTKLFGNENYNRYYQKLENCLIDTEGEVLTYQGQEVEAPYFAVSAEKTRGTELPYLKSVESIWDITSEDFLRVEFYDAGELVDTCNQEFPEAGLTAEDWVNTLVVTEREESGYVKTIQAMKKNIDIYFQKVLAHSGDYYNEVADGLAKKAVGIKK
jgi:stage II sporulation protein D